MQGTGSLSHDSNQSARSISIHPSEAASATDFTLSSDGISETASGGGDNGGGDGAHLMAAVGIVPTARASLVFATASGGGDDGCWVWGLR